jgi:F-type H+/Na+-transporting ATPase subunit alpha
VTDVTRYEESMLADLRANHAGILKTIRDSRDFSDDSKKALMAALDTFTKNFA